jgi:hypothetical protein
MKAIPGYEGYYSATEDGRVYSHWQEKILKTRVTDKGYLRIRLYRDNKWKDFRVHRLIALTYLPNPQNLPEVNHKNGDRQDNHKDNLEWCDRSHNVRHAAARLLKVKPDKQTAALIKMLLDRGVEVDTICENAKLRPSFVLSVKNN